MRFLIWDDFKAKGINYSRQHVKRLVQEKKFPQPVKGVCKENAWTEPTIDQYVEERVAAAKREDVAA